MPNLYISVWWATFFPSNICNWINIACWIVYPFFTNLKCHSIYGGICFWLVLWKYILEPIFHSDYNLSFFVANTYKFESLLLIILCHFFCFGSSHQFSYWFGNNISNFIKNSQIFKYIALNLLTQLPLLNIVFHSEITLLLINLSTSYELKFCIFT